MGKAKEVKYCNDRFSGSLSQERCDVLEELIDLDIDDGCVPDLLHVIYDLNDSDVTEIIDNTEAFGEYTLPEERFKVGTLRKEQTIGVAFMFHAGNCILGDSAGMGKTVEAAGLINLLKAAYEKSGKQFRYLVLTEKNIAHQVRNELVKFTGDYVELVSSGEAKEINKFCLRHPFNEQLNNNIVGTHTLLTTPAFLGWLEQCRTQGCGFPFDLLIIDESSVLGNSTTQVSKGYMAVSKYVKRCIFLNATPFETKLDIFYNQLNMLDPELLPTKTNFNKRYVVMDYRGMFPKPTGKYKNQEEFRRLIGYRYFARARKNKGAVMEDCSGGIMLSSLSDAQKYLMARSQMHKMVYDCPTYLDNSIEFNTENVPKLATLKELLSNQCADADQILIYSHFREAQSCLSEWLSNQGISNRVLNGDTNNQIRQDIIDGFKRSEFRVLITNVQRGLNFGDCDYCIFYSFDPNPSKMIQFEGRMTRGFDVIGKNVYILCSQGKEYEQLRSIVKKRAEATEAMSSTDFSVVLSILLGGDDE